MKNILTSILKWFKEKRKSEDLEEGGENELSGGALCGEFYIGYNKMVRFSKGNLQFNAVQGTHKTADGKVLPGTWRFAEHQWDTIGEGNKESSETYDGFVDFFCWGTSGWEEAQQPWSTSGYNANVDSLTGTCANADWGVYNAISNGGNEPNKWRTLTYGEWRFLLKYNKWSMGTIDGKLCFLLIPEKVTNLVELSEMGMGVADKSFESVEYESNTFTAEQFKKYENQGVVALPCGGNRNGMKMDDYPFNSIGSYWTSSAPHPRCAFIFDITRRYVQVNAYNYDDRNSGISVRLVQDSLTRGEVPHPINPFKLVLP